MQDSGEQPQASITHEAGSSKSRLQSPTTASHSSRYPATYASILRDRSVSTLLGQEGRLAGVEHLTISKPPQELWGLIGLKSYEVQELLNVFFDWQYVPLFAVNRNSMEQAFFEGKGDSCYPALLRSVLCLACRSLDGYDTESSFYVNLGGRLFQEAKSLLCDISDSKGGYLSDAQACGLLAIHQLGSHEFSDALFLIEKCVGMLINLARKTSNVEVRDLSIIDWTSALSTCLHGAMALCRSVSCVTIIRISRPTLCSAYAHRIIHLVFDYLYAHPKSKNPSTNLRPTDKSVLEGTWCMLRIK